MVAGTLRFWSVVRITAVDPDGQVHFVQLDENDPAARDLLAYLARREELALRLAALEAASDPAILAVADDYADRVEANRPYEGAEDAEELLSEAHRRYV